MLNNRVKCFFSTRCGRCIIRLQSFYRQWISMCACAVTTSLCLRHDWPYVRQLSNISVTKINPTTGLALFWLRVTILGFNNIYDMSTCSQVLKHVVLSCWGPVVRTRTILTLVFLLNKKNPFSIIKLLMSVPRLTATKWGRAFICISDIFVVVCTLKDDKESSQYCSLYLPCKNALLDFLVKLKAWELSGKSRNCSFLFLFLFFVFVLRIISRSDT